MNCLEIFTLYSQLTVLMPNKRTLTEIRQMSEIIRKLLGFAHSKGDMLIESDQRFPYCHKCTGKYQKYFYENDPNLRNYSLFEDVYATSADVCRQCQSI